MPPEPGINTIAIGLERTISYLENGSGDPVVLLHGVGSAARSWLGQIGAPLAGCRMIAWDAPGYGRSTALENPAPFPIEYADALAAFADALGLSSFHVVGHSMGALIAVSYARRHADRVRSLTLASVAPGHAWMPEEDRLRLRNGRLDTLRKLGARGMAEQRGPGLLTAKASDGMRRATVETMAAIRPDGWRQAVQMMAHADTRSDLAALDGGVPVQIVFGGEDRITPPESNRRIASARPGALVREIAGAGHAVYIEKAEAFDREIGRFIAANRTSRSKP